ncbi:hypothetical protein C1646_767570 [Rhizophagus diaphanus]|nr:hypothetical protein C1646_767570 [Rhizophagus diaphanus] [Rhizophagus sp. MUCL 43196]
MLGIKTPTCKKNVSNVLKVSSTSNFKESEAKMELNDFLSFEKICEELEEFFINWKDRIPQTSLSLVITNSNIKIEELEEYMKIMIENYKKMGIIMEFIITYYGILELYFMKF